MSDSFKLTYATMFNPPAEVHQNFEKALAETNAKLGNEYAMIIAGEEIHAQETFENRSPINQDWLLGRFQKGDAQHASLALDAARQAFPKWSRTPWQERVTPQLSPPGLPARRFWPEIRS